MKKIVTVIGARPQIIKSAALSRAIQTQFSKEIVEVVVHTGQHYDHDMSEIFFKELGLSKPDYNLHIGSDIQGKQTAKMIEKLEEVLIKEQPDAVVVYGDTNSTLATAVAASKMAIPIVHIEAGLRSFNKTMPEEINRILCDHTSTLLFSPTKTGVENLKNEGFNLAVKPPYTIDNPKVYHCGDIMYDNSMYFSQFSAQHLPKFLIEKPFFLATLHRPSNTDNPAALQNIFEAFLLLIKQYPDHFIVLPLHPRTKKAMEQHLTAKILKIITNTKNLKLIPPASFLTMVALEKHCQLVLTDSGGLQKEAYFFEKPCVILRDETEWVEIIAQKSAILCGSDKNLIVSATAILLENKQLKFPKFYGDGKAAQFIVQEILSNCKTS